MDRVDPTHAQKKRLLEANAHKCCVCKRSSIGFNFHHIDGDSSNTVDENLAVLCVEDHDVHHRPGEYPDRINHLDMNAEDILAAKNSWENFVLEARKPNPEVIATLSSYGTYELIHSLQLVLQWPDERIEYKRSFHLLDGDLDSLTDHVFDELASIGPNVKFGVIDEPLPVEHCPCCGSGFSRTLKSAVVTRMTNPKWNIESSCFIYINPSRPSIALVFFLGYQQLLSGSLHLCRGRYLHYHCDGIDERIAVKSGISVRAQTQEIVNHILNEWSPATVLIGTGDPDVPDLLEDLELPDIWERWQMPIG